MYRLMFFRLLVVLVLVVLDQATKELAMTELAPGMAHPVFPWLNWTLLFNRGAAFSLLADAGGWQRFFLAAISIGVAGFITVLLWRLPAREKLQSSALILLLAGALGNLIDRLRFGEVTDFIQVHYAGWYFPAFNVADSAITVGVIGLFWVELSNWRSESKQQGKE